MNLRPLIIILPFWWWAFDARAQVTEELSSVPEQWQLTLDVIKSKVQDLVVENNGLQVERQKLTGEMQKLEKAVNAQQKKNEQTDAFLKERHGRTDQQLRIEALTGSIKGKRQEAHTVDGLLGRLKRKQALLEHKRRRPKFDDPDGQTHAPQTSDDQLAQWRKQLEDESKKEVLLENELGALKTGGKTQNLDVNAINEHNKQLEARLDFLRLQKLQHLKTSSENDLMASNERKYDQLEKRKDQLMAGINDYESRLDELRQSSLMAFSWQARRKKLIHEMVQTDTRNNQMREKIKELREDIDVLRDQVARLERRVDFVQGKDTQK